MNGWPQGYTVEGWKEGVNETSVRQAYGPRLEPVRRSELIISLIALSCFLFAGHLANAQSLDCGDPPPVAEEDLRAEIKGKAQV